MSPKKFGYAFPIFETEFTEMRTTCFLPDFDRCAFETLCDNAVFAGNLVHEFSQVGLKGVERNEVQRSPIVYNLEGGGEFIRRGTAGSKRFSGFVHGVSAEWFHGG